MMTVLRRQNGVPRRHTRLLLAAALVAGMPPAATFAQSQPSTGLRFDIVGVRLMVDPPALTVPKNIPTQINTSLQLPSDAGLDAQAAIAALTSGALVEAQLRGPSLASTRIVARPGQPLPLPPFAIPGDYFLDGIRLIKDGQPLLDATAADGHIVTTIPIKVISEVFVTNVTSRPLSLDEIRGKGIVIDETNFKAVNFQVAFNVDGAPFTISVPAALPTPEFLKQRPTQATVIQQLTALNQALRGTETSLPPQFDRPGLNFSIAALPFFPVLANDGGVPPLDIPPLTGLVVIPGNVAFLHQFFSVLLVVTNVAPDGTPLELRDATAQIVLPTGLDHVAGTYDQPGDDPLRLARVNGVGVQPTVAVVNPGADGKVGTADDVAAITPQHSGQGEFLVEGLQEGSQQFDLQIRATLFGLPSGPIDVVGAAGGAVFVRNPTFSVTLAHPRTIRSGEQYDLYATVTNTSQSDANLVTVNLDPRGISGAQLRSDAAVAFDTIPAGQARTAKFTLIAQKTGSVTFSSFTGDAVAGGSIRLTTGIDERGVPLAANAIVLPSSTDALPAALVSAAQRVLGQAFSVATAPAAALPPGVLFVKRQTVVDRGVALAQAGERVQFGEPLGTVLRDLLLDWLGNSSYDDGFDQLLRTSDAGAAFIDAMAAAIGADDSRPAALEYQRAFAIAASGRAPHLSVVAAAPPGQPAPFLTMTRSNGDAAGLGAGGALRSLVSAATMTLPPSNGDSRLIVAGSPQPDRYHVDMAARTAGAYDLGVVAPAPDGHLTQWRFAAISLGAGGVASMDVDLTANTVPQLSIDSDGDGRIDAQTAAAAVPIVEEAPHLVAVQQLVSATHESGGDLADPATYGLLVGALFDKPVTAASAERKSNYTIASNAVIGARLQSSQRIVYLYLERPIGALTPRSLGVAGIVDAAGHALGGATLPILMRLSDGAHVFGQVRNADGSGAPGSTLKLTVAVSPSSFDVATIRTDQNGGFDFDFVPRLGNVVLQAQHPVTLDVASLTARVRAPAEQLLLNPTFTGRGAVRGRVLAGDGQTPVAHASIALLPGSVLGSRGFATATNALGEFVFAGVPVGVFTLAASDQSGRLGQTTGVLPTAGAVTALDVVLTAPADSSGHIVGRVFLGDGVTPGAGFAVYVGHYDRDSGRLDAFDQTTAGSDGSFAFGRALPEGAYDVVALDPGTQQLGVEQTSVSAHLTSSVSIVLEATGSVEGVVFNAAGLPQPGALVSGGVALVTTDVNGFFHIDGVPGGRRTLEAGDPVTRRRGSVAVSVLPGQTVRAAITLESRATITGRVLDASGAPVPHATVRIPAIDGYTFVFANDSGVFTFPDLPLGDYLIQAPGPSREQLIGFMTGHGIDPRSAFTSGDVPGDLPEVAPAPLGDANAVLAAYTKAVQAFMSVDETPFTAVDIARLGGFGWTRVHLFQDSTVVASDVRFLAQGAVGGRTVDSAGRPIGALTRVTGLAVSQTGFPAVAELGRMNSDAATGRFDFAGIPRFDLSTFQTAGVRGGDFTVDAAQPFSPVVAQVRGQLTTTTPNLTDLVVQFPGATETNGTIAGRVLLPGGAPAPAGTTVAIDFGDLTVLTDANGQFLSALPIPAGVYHVTASTATGYRGKASVLVVAGQTAHVDVQLLGLGSLTIAVRRTTGTAVAGAAVSLERGTFPFDKLDGVTDGAGNVRFTNVSEGAFAARAQEAVTGLTGRAAGSVIRDTEQTAVLVITPSGRVTGRFMSADGAQPIPFAQVALTTGPISAFATTDASGHFELLAIPVGPFTIEAGDPATGRIGRASDAVVFEGQTVDVTVLQAPRGTVTGFVVQADGTTTVPGATVRLHSDSFVATDLQATTRDDGSFRFEGVPAGTFTLTGRDPIGGFEGTADGRLESEGQSVDVTIELAPYGALKVSARTAAGQAVTNAAITVTRGTFSRTAAAAADGTFTFDLLPLGDYQIVARSLSDAGDGGYGRVTLAVRGTTVESVVVFRGSGTVTVSVVASDGVTRVPSARVTLAATGAAASEVPGALATTAIGFTNANGDVTFVNVPVGSVAATAESAALAGIVTGALDGAGASVPLTVRLGAAGSVAGRVLLPDGRTPAAQAIVTLRFTSQTSLQTGVVQSVTPLNGTFSFAGIPLGPFTVSAFEVVSTGVRNLTSTLAVDGGRLDLGDLILDNAGPRVMAVTPADRSAAAPVSSSVSITFDEPLAAASIATGASGNIGLMDGTAAVSVAAPVLSPDGRTVTIAPVQPLRSGARYTVIVKGGQDGPKDVGAGLPLLDSFVSTFTTRDVIPPTVVAASPAAGDRQVPLESAVRVSFSEAVATATLQLRDAAGRLVPGSTALTAGNAAVAFTPLAVLQANTTYVATLSGVTDLAGNPLAAGTVTISFNTLDTIAPTITSLQITGSRRAGSQLTVTPVIPGGDAQRVEYLVGGTPLAATAAPFAASTTLPASGSVLISAVAIDEFGNRSSAVTQQVDILANAPPTVTLRAVDPTAAILQGHTIEFEAAALDDDGVAQLLLSAVGAAAYSETRSPATPASPFAARFSVTIPADAPSGGIVTVQAAAIDTAGAAGDTARLQLTVADGRRPGLTIVSPVNNAVVVPGQPVSIVADATDDVAVTAINVICTPALAGCGLRAIQPAPATRQTFSLDVPAVIDGPSISVLIRASDAAGNVTETARTLFVPDQAAPVLSALEPVSGSLRVVPGSTATFRATVSDAMGVTSLAYESTGALATSGTVPVAPAVTSGTALLALPIPASLPNGGTITVLVTARDAAGNTSAPGSVTLTVGDSQPPAIAILSPDAGTQVNPGQSVTFTVRATDDAGVSRLIFNVAGSVSASETRAVATAASVDAQFTVTVPAGPTAGTFVFSAQAVDAAGNSSAVATRSVDVRDTAVPVVSITSPSAATPIDPRSPIAVTVSATDNVAVAAVDLSWAGAAAGSETRTLQTPQPATSASFTLSIATPPPTSGLLTLSASARDAAGNTGNAASVTLTILDVVPPTLQSIVPADGASAVDPGTSVVLTFSEPLEAATVSTSSVQLSNAGAAIAASVSLATDGRTVTITPAAPLPINTLITVSAANTILDRAGNALTAFASTFRTASPDTTHPFLDRVSPADGAVGVPTTAAIAAAFSEPISADSVTPQTFRVTVNGTAIAGTYSLSNGGRVVTFTPDAALPFSATVVSTFSAGITDLAGNALATREGDPLPAPLSVTFTTGDFAITSPAGNEVVEGDRITIGAGAGASLQVSQVVFTVDGVAAGSAAAPPFSVGFTVPPRPRSGTLTLAASALNAQGSEIARAEKTVTVVSRIRAVPAIVGLARGGTGSIRLQLDEPAAQDLIVALAPVDSQVVSIAAPSVVIPAGATSVSFAVTACSTCPWDPVAPGRAVGNTSIVASSDRGVALASVSVSDPVAGQSINTVGPSVGVSVTMPRRAGDVLLGSGAGTRTLGIAVVTQPLAGTVPVPVEITSSDPTIATATAPDLLPGQSLALLTIVSGRDGVATLTIRVGREVSFVVVRVGPQPAGSTPVIAASPIGISVTQAPFLGQVVISGHRTSTISVQVLSAPNAGAQPVPVVVTSSDPATATATATAVQPGSSVTELTITAGADGFVTLLLRAGSEVHALTVFVGVPPTGRAAPILAAAIGIASPGLPVAGRAFAAPGSSASIGIVLLDAPSPAAQPVAVASSNPAAVAITTSNPSIAAGSQVLPLSFTTGAAGSATLTLTVGAVQRQFTIVVGAVSPASQPVTAAPPVGLSVIPSAQAGRVLVAQGAPVNARLGVQLLTTARATSTAVLITSSNTAVVGLGGGASVTAEVTAGTVTVPVDLFTTGAAGTAVLRFSFDGTVLELLVVVGNPPASDRPAITAPVIGIRIGS